MASIEIPTSNNISTPAVDTSSYRLALPANQNNALGTAQQLGGLQQQKIQIDRQKLELMNDRFKIINNELSTLANDPTASREKILNKLNMLSRMGLVPKEQLAEFEKDVPQDPKQLPQFLEQTLQRGMSVMEHINFQYGQPGSVDTGQATIPTVTSPRFGVRATNAPIQRQLPPGTPVVNPETGQPAALGAQPYQGAPGGSPVPLPVAPQVGRAPVAPVMRVAPATPIPSQAPGGLPTGQGAPQAAPNGLPVAQPPATAAPMGGPPRSTGPVTGLAPGEANLMESSAKSYVNELEASKNYQREVFPLKQAIQALDRLGTTGTGPGTEEIQLVKSFLLSNIGTGLFSKEQIDNIKDFDEARKYLTDFVNQTGNAGTNDKLAAAFAGNPNIHISNAAAVDVAKSALALRNQKQAMTLEFQKTGLPGQQFNKWASQWVNQHDPRGFAFDMMEPEAQKKLINNLKKKPTEAENFTKSHKLARSLGM